MTGVVAGVNIIGTEQGIFTQVVVQQSSTVRVEVWYNFVVIERRIGNTVIFLQKTVFQLYFNCISLYFHRISVFQTHV